MKVVYKDVNFDVNDIISKELPFMSAFYHDGSELNSDVKDLLSFHIKNSNNLPFYTIDEQSTYKMYEIATKSYRMFVSALRELFREDDSVIMKFFGCDMLKKHGSYFIPYAKYTFENKNKLTGMSLYGRFDLAVDPSSEEVVGIYEFNGDTPVMLFESVNLQNHYSTNILKNPMVQYNSWYDTVNIVLSEQYLNRNHQFAVACATSYVEDMATSETLAQVIGEHCASHILDLIDIDYDHLSTRKPFVISGSDTYLDSIFLLMPWEEMVEAFPVAFMNWTDWADNVSLHEPAWKWFLSHKGMMAYITHLMETDKQFQSMYSDVPILKTYLSSSKFVDNKQAYVSKPVLGRLSSNINIYDEENELVVNSNGSYGDCERVYQEYCAPGQVDDRNNFIVGMWVAGDEAATMCIREFDNEVLELCNERFIPHIVV